MATAPKIKCLTIDQKFEIISELNTETIHNFTRTAEKHGVSRTVISRLWKNRNEFMKQNESLVKSSRKRKKAFKEEDVDAALSIWLQCRNDARVNAPILKSKAQQLAQEMGHEFIPSDGWINRFKERHNLSFKREYGEKPIQRVKISKEAKDVTKKRKIESDSPTPHHHHNSSSQHQRQQQDVKVEGEEGEAWDDDQEQQEPSTSSDNNNLLSDLDLSHTIEEAVPVPGSEWSVPIKHEPEVEMTSSLEARLQYLETREVAMTRDIIRLKTENVELRTQLLDGVADNSRLQLSLKKLERKCAKLEGDLMEICGFRDGVEDLEEGLRRLEDRMKDIKDMEGRLNSREPPEITSSNQLMATKPNLVDQGGDSFSSEIEAMKNSIQALEHMNSQYSQSVVDVELWPCDKMEPNTPVKLNKCIDVFKNHGVFQTSECVLHPETDGDYLMCVVYRQSGVGSVSMTARVDGEEGGRHFGQTGNDGESLESCCSQVMRLVQGQRVWLEAIGGRGDPAIDMCRFYCRLIGM